ncbi:uncharacterized protein LOC128727667 [Anopheles nili]|uniref:uncharacterized protein LOC128727667 n=1 Tax=Anopheles nili TaxID=185578 RepID=UPI00237BA92B|nr:uncharacterized protein LOC128727667 [Anopheles nili]
MLMANGIQMERLLRFGDKTRIIDTRARFILLHNYRLFVPQMHYIWKRIVNVLFIRRVKPKKMLTSLGRPPVYELSTVPFPIPIKNVFFSKIINFWQAGKFRLINSTFFNDKTNNLGDQNMRVVVLEHTPAIFKAIAPNDAPTNARMRELNLLDSNSTTDRSPFFYYGLEMELLKAIAEAMHFQMNLYETADADNERWGTVQGNETLTGILKEMHEGLADFALADLHHTEYHLRFMDLSIPYNTECLTFLTPEALSDNSWKTLILPFNGEMWAGVLISLFLVGFIFYGFSNTLTAWYDADKKLQNLRMIPFKRKPEPWHDTLPKSDIFDHISGCIIYTFSMLLLVSLPRLPNGWTLRVLIGWYWVYCVLVVVAYRASFTAILANPIPRLTIDTLQDLADSSIRCGAWGEQNRLFFERAQDPHSQTIGAKLEHSPDSHQAVEQVGEGLFAYYENIYLLRQLRSTGKSEKTRQTLHIMQQCAVHMPISIGLEKNSPLKYQVDRYVRALVEGGLTGKWLSDAIQRFQSNVELPPQEAIIDLKKMYAGIVALCLGYTVALCTFCAEKFYWRYYVETNPGFDKYLLGFSFNKHS